ncbi:hypothetical protein [Planomonospora venezuelensis]|uniref:Peptidoglycan hydrolase CwlO-like protein n=1 Tax=Planomonospora venezuelensis TaxID=1999 RepID=A0A841D982_PLAVE|nr:hypothetical protein [Planomonospora venezuelensis]MBB5965413.1 peptidoglycan hydrolase CwlO-like protein [Planomonospora venezuelensis]GIM62510.1 hypothetical protein Pve01_76840 [Planomonospora venezuelensis]
MIDEIIRAKIREEVVEYMAPVIGQILVKMDTLATKKDLERFATKEDLNEVKRDVAVLKTDVTGLKADVAGLKSDMVEVKRDVAGLKSDMVEVKQDVAGLKSDVAGLKEDFGTMDGKLDRIIHLLGMPPAA